MKSISSIAIVGNGVLLKDILVSIQDCDYIIGVDRAAYWLIEHNITPDYAIGDFDSVTRSEFQVIKKKVLSIQTYKPEKDFTDMELAIQYAATLHPQIITVFGALGNRMDHSIGNIFLLDHFSDQPFDLHLVDQTNDCFIVKGNKIVTKSKKYKYLSLLSLSDYATVSLTGFAYELQYQQITRGQTIGISNEIVKKTATITVHSGKILIIQSRDA